MSKIRKVTEQDFRKEEFVGSNPDDYEFREDGAIVRKDRWQIGILNIASILSLRDFEVSDVVEKVRELKDKNEHFDLKPLVYIYGYHLAMSEKQREKNK